MNKNLYSGIMILMKTIKRYTIMIVYYIFCIISTVIVVLHCGIIFFHSIFSIFDFQVLIFLLLSFLLIVGFWMLLFVRIHLAAKCFIFTLLLCIQLNYIELSTKIPTVNRIIDEYTCLDTRICKEGIQVNTQHGILNINKQNCLKHDWIWDENLKSCKITDL